ncbi:MAG TPA: hypothetical protein VFS15_15300 [Kofleriaceae bacterium]|nr:hypothetical protein [Kofleriaceae bacterium]
MRTFVVAFVGIAAALSAPVRADPAEDQALAHLDRGIAAFEAKDFRTARREFTQAHELVPDKANPYRWLALAEIQLGDCPAALPHITGFLARVPTTDSRVAEMTRWRDFCVRETAPQVTGTRDLAQPAPPPPRHEALHERWWFWPLVGTAALAATGAIIYVAADGGEPVLPSIHCDNTGCRK